MLFAISYDDSEVINNVSRQQPIYKTNCCDQI